MPNDWETTLPVATPNGSGAEDLRVVIVGNQLAATHQLPSAGSVSIGRSEESTISINDPAISRRHAVLHVNRVLTLEDLGSANGTYLRGTRIESGRTVQLEIGDVVEVGATLLIIQGKARPGGAIAPMPGERPMEALYRVIDRIARTQLSVLLLGETGVGKGFIAAELHRRSNRAQGPFVQINCAALPHDLLESQLFGHEKGAFTGAIQTKGGLIESASGGTLLLDEIGELPLQTQPKMLRVLEEREVLPVGALRPRAVDVRFISATNRDLEAQVGKGGFREDLFFRLNGISIEVPPLRKRVSEIPALAVEFARSASIAAGLPAREISPQAIEALRQYRWPGNIRELRNLMERAVALSTGPVLDAKDLPLEKMTSAPAVARMDGSSNSHGSPEEHPQRKRILETLERCGWNQSRAASELKMSRQTLSARLDEYNIPRPRKVRKA